MGKYRLIDVREQNTEHLCDKVTIDGFDYYVSDKETKWAIDENNKLVNLWFYPEKLKGFVLATNNPTIDISKVVDAKLIKYKIAEHEYQAGKRERKHTEQETFINGWNKCLQSKETRSFSEEDMIEFAEWIVRMDWNELSVVYEKSTKELLKLWKDQQTKIVYYEPIAETLF